MSTNNTSNATEFFIEFIKIKSVHPQPAYKEALQLLEKRCKMYGFQWEEFALDEQGIKPIGIATWKGSNPALPSVLLNSHTDVVPVETAKWNCDPFSGYKDPQGNIFGRGTQDMKSVGVQHIEALGRLKRSNKQLLRTVHILMVPDEEIGGVDGMRRLLKSDTWARLNVGLALDEGLANPEDAYTVFYGERAPWWVRVKASGPTGHGSRFIQNTAMEKLVRSVNKFLEFRSQQESMLAEQHSECGKRTLGDVTTVNLTSFHGGSDKAVNVVPSEAEACFDIRIPPTVNLEEFRKQVQSWTAEEGLELQFIQHTAVNNATSTDPESMWYKVFRSSLDKHKRRIDLEIFPAATDSRFLRAIGVPAFGFSPMRNTPILLHDHNEFLNESIFIEGISVFETLIEDLANTPEPK